jgi:hypothetical protein
MIDATLDVLKKPVDKQGAKLIIKMIPGRLVKRRSARG